MLNEILKALLITSLAGTCLAVVITLAKPITKKVFDYSWHYYIWLAVLVVMVLPVRFTLPQMTDISPVTEIQTVQPEPTAQTTATSPDNAVPAAQEKPDILKSGTAFVQRIIDNRLSILATLWLIGAALLLLVGIFSYIRLVIKMRKNSVVVSCPELMNFTDKRVTVRVWENTSSPFMTGIFKPTLVLPAKELTDEQLNNILRHEMTHFKRHDILYKWFVSLVKCMHWFNPVIWYVAKQVNIECEISCDMAVTLSMDENEEMSYIDTVLSLLPMGKTRQIPLTTQMASSKKILKRRFTMIRNKKKTSKIMSVISALVAVVMLSTTVFASGALSNLATDNYTVEITNNGEKIELANKPFIENGEVYVPLREIFEKAISEEEGLTDIKWNDGTINVVAAYYQGESGAYQFKIGENYMKVKHINFKEFENVSFNMDGVVISIGLRGTPLLLHSTTYVTVEDMNYMLYGFTNRRDANKNLIELTYHIYDKSGNIVDFNGFYHQVLGEYSIKIPDSWGGKYTVETSENGDMLSFVQKATYDKYGEGSGVLFRIEKVSAEAADELLNMLEGSRLLYKNDEYAYIFEIPTDVQYPIWVDRDEEDVETAAEYEKMFADVYSVADSFTLTEVQ